MKRTELSTTSHAAIIRAAREAVAGALDGDFPVDPLIGKDLSYALSCVGSVIKRHGGLIEMAIEHALKASDRLVVLRNVPLPLTKAALQLIDAKNTDETLAKVKLSADSEAAGIVNVDLLVVDPEAGWAGAYDCKRGNGATEHGKRHPIIRKLRAVRPLLASFVQKLGYGPIETTRSAVIDYYGGSGFGPEIKLCRHQLDDHFGVQVVGTVEAMTAAVREAMAAQLPRLFEPVFDRMTLPERVPNPGTESAGAFACPRVSTRLAVPPPVPVGPKRRTRRPVVRH